MSAPEYFEIAEGHAVFRPVGRVPLQQAVKMVLSAILYAREQKIRNLLADLTGLTGIASPSAVARYQFMKEGAQTGAGAVRLAMVLSPEIFDPRKFGVLVGRHHGLVSDTFVTEEDALAWLLGGS